MFDDMQKDLCDAIERGNLERAKELLDNGCCSVHDAAERGSEDWWTPLQFARYSVPMTRLLLDRGASLDDSTESDPRTALHLASENGYLEVARLHLDRGAEVDVHCNWGSPLYFASKRGKLEVARLLLDRGADINLVRKLRSGGPLHVASFMGELAMVKLLLDRGADVNAGSERGRIPLSWACRSGNVEIARLLLERGAKMEDDILLAFFDKKMGDEDDFWFFSPFCSGNDHVELLGLLLDLGANPNVSDSKNWTLLTGACRYGKLSMVRLLLDRGVSVDGNDGEDGPRPLHVACRYGLEAIARLLLDRGADVNAIDSKGETPLHAVLNFDEGGLFGSTESKSDLFLLLLDRGAAADTTTRETNETALHMAIRRFWEGEGIVEALLDRGVNVDAQNSAGDTPLHRACQMEIWGTVQLLLDRDATVNVTNEAGQIPLHLLYERADATFESVHLKITKLFLDRGANVNAKDENGFTPLHLMCVIEYYAEYDDDDDFDDDEEDEDDGEDDDDEDVEDDGEDNDDEDVEDDDGEDEGDAVDDDHDGGGSDHSGHIPLKIVRLLIDRGADVEATTNAGLTPMHLACQEGYYTGGSLQFVWLFVRRYPWLVLQQYCPAGDDERKKKRQRLSS